jgi:hypothetical protein
MEKVYFAFPEHRSSQPGFLLALQFTKARQTVRPPSNSQNQFNYLLARLKVVFKIVSMFFN